MFIEITKQMKISDNILSESFLIGVLYLMGALSLCEDIVRLGRQIIFNYFDDVTIHHEIMD